MAIYFLLISSCVNIVLDIILIGGLHLGVVGAAIATNLSQLLAMVASIVYLTKKYPNLIAWRNMKFDKNMAVQILRIGLPMAIWKNNKEEQKRRFFGTVSKCAI